MCSVSNLHTFCFNAPKVKLSFSIPLHRCRKISECPHNQHLPRFWLEKTSFAWPQRLPPCSIPSCDVSLILLTVVVAFEFDDRCRIRHARNGHIYFAMQRCINMLGIMAQYEALALLLSPVLPKYTAWKHSVNSDAVNNFLTKNDEAYIAWFRETLSEAIVIRTHFQGPAVSLAFCVHQEAQARMRAVAFHH